MTVNDTSSGDQPIEVGAELGQAVGTSILKMFDSEAAAEANLLLELIHRSTGSDDPREESLGEQLLSVGRWFLEASVAVVCFHQPVLGIVFQKLMVEGVMCLLTPDKPEQPQASRTSSSTVNDPLGLLFDENEGDGLLAQAGIQETQEYLDKLESMLEPHTDEGGALVEDTSIQPELVERMTTQRLLHLLSEHRGLVQHHEQLSRIVESNGRAMAEMRRARGRQGCSESSEAQGG